MNRWAVRFAMDAERKKLQLAGGFATDAGKKKLQKRGFEIFNSGSAYRLRYKVGRRSSTDESARALFQTSEQFDKQWQRGCVEWAQVLRTAALTGTV